MAIYFIRHTTPDVEEGTAYGQTDLDVIHSFPQESAAVKALLPDLQDYTFYASPLQRCRKLAEVLVPEGKTIHFDDRIKELAFGDWEMTRWEDLPQPDLQEWFSNFVERSAPGGETFLKFYERITDFWEELLEEDHENIVVVAHSGVLHTIVAHLLEIPLDNVFALQMGYGHIVRITPKKNWKWSVELIQPKW